RPDGPGAGHERHRAAPGRRGADDAPHVHAGGRRGGHGPLVAGGGRRRHERAELLGQRADAGRRVHLADRPRAARLRRRAGAGPHASGAQGQHERPKRSAGAHGQSARAERTGRAHGQSARAERTGRAPDRNVRPSGGAGIMAESVRAALAVFRKERIVLLRYPTWIVAVLVWPALFPPMHVLMATAISAPDARAVRASRSVSGTEDYVGYLLFGTTLWMILNMTLWNLGSHLRMEQIRGTLEATWTTAASRLGMLLGASGMQL